MASTRPRRTLLFTPGDRPERVTKALATADADVLVIDWEDAVAAASKEAARETTRRAWPAFPESRTERVIRVNAVATPWHPDDVATAVALAPSAILLPKADSVEDVQAVSARMLAAERTAGLPEGSVRLLLLIESPRGVLHAEAIGASDARVDGLVWGADDYQVALGGRRRRDNLDVLHARSHVAMVARVLGISATDQVCTDIHDTAEVHHEASFARDLGYDGKIVIHPKQVTVVNAVFAPSAGEIGWARGLLDAAAAAENEGRGAFAYEGAMVDRPIIMQARAVIARAKAAGLAK